MASYAGAYERISGLIHDEKPLRSSPATISGNQTVIASYQKVIGRMQDDGSWLIVEDHSTPTTNRHIRALRMVLNDRHVAYGVVPYEQSL